MFPIEFGVANQDLKKYPTFKVFSSRLDYLVEGNAAPGIQTPLQRANAEQDQAALAALDQEMSRLISRDLDYRKLEKKPQNFESSIPLGLASAADGKMNLLMKAKKKKKSVLKTIN